MRSCRKPRRPTNGTRTSSRPVWRKWATPRPAVLEITQVAGWTFAHIGVAALATSRCLENRLISETLRLTVVIEGASVVERILRHLRLPTAVPTPRPGRAPPLFAPCSFEGGHGHSGLRSVPLTGALRGRLAGGVPARRPA